MRILIAEDDHVLADGLLRALRGTGAAVDHVSSGTEAETVGLGLRCTGAALSRSWCRMTVSRSKTRAPASVANARQPCSIVRWITRQHTAADCRSPDASRNQTAVAST